MGAYRAVKIVFRDSFDSERPFERELWGIRKFEPVSRLHEGFIDILQVGLNEPKGYFYYIMEVGDDQVTGQRIDPPSYVPNTLGSEIARRGRLSLQECLQLGLALTHALAELQKHGLVHRDIKPGNVIFVNGVPKLADIGLVTSVDDTLSFVGTAGFIAPEGPGKPEADIYSLGMVLYEASTGKDRHDFPFIPADWSELPEYLGLLELNEVILQACKEKPIERYRSAWDMHADLVVVLNGKSVKQLKQLQRRMAQLKRVAAIAAVILAIVGPSSYELYRTRRAAREEQARKVAADISFGNRAMEAGNLLEALPYFAEALRLDEGNTNAQRNDRLRVGSILANSPKITHMWFEPKDVKDAEFSPDDRQILVAQYYGDERIYDIESQESRTISFGTNSGVRSSVFSPNGRLILITGEANQAVVWDAVSLTNIHSLPHNDKVYMGRFSPDGTRIVTACKDGIVRVWDTLAGTNIYCLEKQSDPVTFAGFSHNGKFILTTSQNHVAALWNADDGSCPTNQFKHEDWVNWAAFSPDDKKIVTACGDHRARVWDLETNRRIYQDLVHNDAVESAEFSPDGRFILTASLDGTVRLWRTGDLQPATPCSILPHGEAVTHATFSSDGRRILTACMDGTIRIWDLAGATMPPKGEPRVYCRTGCRFITTTNTSLQVCDSADDKPVSTPFAPAAPLENYQLSDSGRFVVTSSIQATPEETNSVIQVWDAQTARAIGPPLVVKKTFAEAAALTRNGDHIAIYGTNQVRIYETRTTNETAGPLVSEGAIRPTLFSPEGDLVVTISGRDIQVWNARTGQPQYEKMTVPVPIDYAEFSPDGKFLITCSSDQLRTRCSAQIWVVKTGQAFGDPLKHSDGVLTASFSPTGDVIVTTSEDFTAKIWDAKASTQIGLPLRHGHQVESAAWSPRGDWVATASIDQTARVWDPQTGDPLMPPLFHLATLWNVRFLPDGAHLVCEDKRGNSYKWNLLVDSKSAEDITEIAELLSGGGFISPVSPKKETSKPLNQTWMKLRANHPKDFATSREDVARWYEFQVQDSESAGDRAAAAFHLRNLLKLRPGDKSLEDHLATMQEQQKRQN
jgi:WD40 repeat protein